MAEYASTEVNRKAVLVSDTVRRFSGRPTRVSELTQCAKRSVGAATRKFLGSSAALPPGLGELDAVRMKILSGG